MDLDNITDIEVLKKRIKEALCKLWHSERG